MPNKRICIIPKYTGIGGPSSFLDRLKMVLNKRGIEVIHDLNEKNIDSILVINSTKDLFKLYLKKKQGVRIVQRLGSPSLLWWYFPLSLHKYTLDIIRNLMNRCVRSILADAIVYQSNYVKEDWDKMYGKSKVPSEIIYNGVDKNTFTNVEHVYQSKRDHCIISVEGMQGLDPFDIAINLGKRLDEKGVDFELLMFGIPHHNIDKRVANYPFIKFLGPIARFELPFYYAGSDCYLLTDLLGAGCPNSVLEALSCGTPVLSYDLGVISEMINDDSGVLIKGNGDPWKGQNPKNFDLLAEGAIKLFNNKKRFNRGALKIAKDQYDLNQMAEKYIDVLYPTSN